MRAAIMRAPFDVLVGDWETPRPGPGEILVSVAAAGVCAGDMYFYLGKNPYAVYPQICGHEISGVVAELGEGIGGPAPGTPVVVEPFVGCGACYPCHLGKSNCCTNLRILGIHRPGGFAEQVVAPATHIHPIPEGLDGRLAALAEPLAIGVQSCRRGGVSAGETVLVLGCGPIGLAILEVARDRGARVIATDVLPSRLEVAAEMGAEVLPADGELLGAVLALTDGEGAPVVMEATGNPRVMEQTVELVASGGRIVIVGLVKQGVSVSFPGLDFTRKEMTLVGSRASVRCFPEALDLLARGATSLPRVVTQFDLWDAPRVFRDMADHPGRVHKALFVR